MNLSWIVLLLILSVPSPRAGAKSIFVEDSEHGHDKDGCGSRTYPCKTIRYAIEERVEENDIVSIMPRPDNTSYQQCGTPARVSRNVAIEGAGSMITLDCNGTANSEFLIIDGSGLNSLNLRITSLRITGYYSIIQARDVSLYVENLHIENNNFVISTMREQDNSIQCSFLNLSISQSKLERNELYEKNFYKSAVVLDNCTHFDILIASSIFNSTDIDVDYYHSLRAPSGNRVVNIKNSSFYRSHYDGKNAIMRFYILKEHYFDVTVSSCMFYGYAAIYMTGTTSKSALIKYNVRDSSFRDSISGALYIRIKVDKNTEKFLLNITFTGCTFSGNNSSWPAGAIYMGVLKYSNDHIIGAEAHIRNCTFSHNRAKLSDGGALYVDGVHLKLFHTQFYDNFAALGGNSIYMKNRANATLKYVKIFGRQAVENLHVVSEMYFTNEIDLDMNHVDISFSRDPLTQNDRNYVIQLIDGNHSIDDVNITCAEGYLISRLESDLIHAGIPSNSLWYFCESCPLGFYTLGKGTSYDGTLKNDTCHNCPYGASCIGSPRARHNFWGFEITNGSERRIEMLQCPPGYCCQGNDTCRSYNSCNTDREGPLCARCKTGFSEGLLSTRCIKDETCSQRWVWIPILLCVIAAFLLLFWKSKAIDFFSNTTRMMCSPVSLIESCFQHKGRNNSRVADGQGKTYLNIVFFYYQIALLFKVDLPQETEETSTATVLYDTVFGLFLFRIEWFAHITCPSTGITPLTKQLLYILPVFLFYILLGFIFIVIKVQQKTGNTHQSQPRVSRSMIKLSDCFLQIVSLTYITVIRFVFTVSKCVYIEDTRVMWIDGSLPCPQQPLTILSFVLYAIPFCLVLSVGPLLLAPPEMRSSSGCSDEEIEPLLATVSGEGIPLWLFYVCCVLPCLFYLTPVYLLLIWLLGRNAENPRGYVANEIDNEGLDSERHIYNSIQEDICQNDLSDSIGSVRSSVIKFLNNPSRKTPSNSCCQESKRPFCQKVTKFLEKCSVEGVLNARKLVLVACLTLISDRFTAFCVVTFTCTLFLIINIKWCPHEGNAGILETITLSLLVCFAAFNVGKAAVYSQGITVKGPAEICIRVLDYLQFALTICLFVAVAGLWIVFAIVRLLFLCLKKCKILKLTVER